ncbi:MAG: hypothetical protein GY927_13955 [bacterium]|nr:hypothetical protein [bacterium]
MRRTYAEKIILMVFAWLLGGFSPALAVNQQDYCIKCSNPDEIYVCRITTKGGQSQGQQFLCIMNIAKDHGHDSCSATAQSATCSGVLVRYEVSGSDQTPDPSNTTTTGPIEAPEANQTKGEPKTLIEFTKQATKATSKGLKSAGKDTKKVIKNTGKAIKKTGGKIKGFTDKVGGNIKSASKTTWRCLTSLFFNCAGD